MVKTIHTDKYGDVMTVYRGNESNLIFIDGMFDDLDAAPAWRGIYKPEQARKIANRLTQLADLIEEKSV